MVLAALWRKGPLSFASLIDEVKASQPWGDATIKTLLSRLMRKSAIQSVRDDGRQRYHPLIDRQAYIDAELRLMADRLFGGDLVVLATHLPAGRTATSS
ncbi:MAG: BlaI/MecI/CopY family transcriptional regulator [Caulobacteraceae bacterium]|nr:BlaI/MecI/CopY family transcriptional regulator [Caulobacteraceae bacterium]